MVLQVPVANPEHTGLCGPLSSRAFQSPNLETRQLRSLEDYSQIPKPTHHVLRMANIRMRQPKLLTTRSHCLQTALNLRPPGFPLPGVSPGGQAGGSHRPVETPSVIAPILEALSVGLKLVRVQGAPLCRFRVWAFLCVGPRSCTHSLLNPNFQPHCRQELDTTGTSQSTQEKSERAAAQCKLSYGFRV